MVVSKTEFNTALNEINASYKKLHERIEKLEQMAEEKAKEKPAPKTRSTKDA